MKKARNPVSKPETYWFVNSQGKRIGFPGDATIEDLVRAGVTDIDLVPKGTPPTPTRYIHEDRR